MKEQLDEAGVKFDAEKHKEETILDVGSLEEYCETGKNEPIEGVTQDIKQKLI